MRELIALEGTYRTDSLVCAIEEALLMKERSGQTLADEALVVLTVESMEREVNNGGFQHMFSSIRLDLILRLLASLECIKATETRNIVQRAFAGVGIIPGDDPATVEGMLPDRLDQEEVLDVLSAADSNYYDLKEDIAGLLFAFVKANIMAIA